MDSVKSEPCYNLELQFTGKWPFYGNFPFYSFVKFHGNKMWEPQHDSVIPKSMSIPGLIAQSAADPGSHIS